MDVFAVGFRGVRKCKWNVSCCRRQDFSAPYAATEGLQAGTADLDVDSSGTIADGMLLAIEANNSQFNDPSDTFLDLFFTGGSLLEDFVLAYEVLRVDGSGANAAPDTINWSYSLDGAPLTAVGSNAIAPGANSETIDLTGIFAVNQANDIQLRATFDGANGGAKNSLTFDNIQISATAVPEPNAFLLVFTIIGGVFGWRFFTVRARTTTC